MEEFVRLEPWVIPGLMAAGVTMLFGWAVTPTDTEAWKRDMTVDGKRIWQ